MHSSSFKRSSSPIKSNVKTFTIGDLEDSINDPFLETGDSTRSLLKSLNSHDKQSLQEDLSNEESGEVSEEGQISYNQNETFTNSLVSQNISSIYSRSEVKAGTSSKSSLSSTYSKSSLFNSTCKDATKGSSIDGSDVTWEKWLVKKTIEDIENMNLRRERRKERAMAKRKKEEEKMTLLKKSVEQREEWLKKKDEELEKKIKENTARILAEKLKNEEEERLIEEKAQAKFDEWQREKLAKEKELRKQKIEERRKAEELLAEKKLNSEQSYRRWLENAKTKKFNRSTLGYSGGGLFSYYDMGCSPEPSYKNPLPWVDVSDTNEKLSRKELFMSPPLLWKDIEKRESSRKSRGKKLKKDKAKHFCNAK